LNEACPPGVHDRTVVRDLNPSLPPLALDEFKIQQVFTPHESVAVVQIDDTGPGILAEHLGKVFDPFFTTKSDRFRYRSGTLRVAADRADARRLD